MEVYIYGRRTVIKVRGGAFDINLQANVFFQVPECSEEYERISCLSSCGAFYLLRYGFQRKCFNSWLCSSFRFLSLLAMFVQASYLVVIYSEDLTLGNCNISLCATAQIVCLELWSVISFTPLLTLLFYARDISSQACWTEAVSKARNSTFSVYDMGD